MLIDQSLSNEQVARTLGIPREQLQRYDVPELNIKKFSPPRPTVKVTRYDVVMHSAAYANLISEAESSEQALNPEIPKTAALLWAA